MTLTVALAPAVAAARYSYGGHHDRPDRVLDVGGSVIEHHVGLPGNATYTATPAGGVYRHANAHGDTITTTGASGERVSAGHYGPYGETPEPADGTTTVPNTSWGWHGHQHRLTDSSIIHMGARPYHPTLGRFLQVDPIEGGCANDYTYVRGDPLSESDVSGLAGCPGWLVRGARIVGVGDWIRAGFEVVLGDAGRGAQDLSNRYAEKVATDGVKQGWTGLLGSRFGSVASHVVKGLGLVRAFPVVAGATFIDAWCQRSGSDDPVVR